eukprot:CAMPEP_0177605286 /NCGR_PEP_ID=MMETSP0419_2-20121207/16613_1 /TAXON_ID=582737 /ORGANISM="Tetraselmis sp., Strain GSL018" /LENGTH=181 /DNA_ID=CAMNT_0019099411 /DNA_START=202 /DNA_END=743 /DNA_ORIENTATION=+
MSNAKTWFPSSGSPNQQPGLRPIQKALPPPKPKLRPTAMDKHKRFLNELKKDLRDRSLQQQARDSQDEQKLQQVIEFSKELRAAVLRGDKAAVGSWRPVAAAKDLERQRKQDCLQPAPFTAKTAALDPSDAASVEREVSELIDKAIRAREGDRDGGGSTGGAPPATEEEEGADPVGAAGDG